MKKFLTYTICLLIPFITICIGMELFFRQYGGYHQMKANYLKTNATDIKILILGSSHGANGIDPNYLPPNAYNAAQGAQTLDIDYAILNRYKDELRSLEYLVVPVSYQSLWLKIGRVEDYRYVQKYYNVYYDAYVETNPLKCLFFLEYPMSKQLSRICRPFFEKRVAGVSQKYMSPLGLLYYGEPISDEEELSKHGKGVARAFTRSDLMYEYDNNVGYLKKMIGIVKAKKAKIIFITLPGYKSYVNNMNEEQLSMMRTTMTTLVDNETSFYFDCLEDGKEYVTSDFSNGDHLSYRGARKITHKIDSIIKAIDRATN